MFWVMICVVDRMNQQSERECWVGRWIGILNGLVMEGVN